MPEMQQRFWLWLRMSELQFQVWGWLFINSCQKLISFDKRCEKKTNLTPTYFFDPNRIENVIIVINCQTCSNIVLQPYLAEYESCQNEIDTLTGKKEKHSSYSDYGEVILIPSVKKARLDDLYRTRKIITDYKCRNPACHINGSESYELPSKKYSNIRALDREVYTAIPLGQNGRDRAILKFHRTCWEQLQRKLGLGLVFKTKEQITTFCWIKHHQSFSLLFTLEKKYFNFCSVVRVLI